MKKFIVATVFFAQALLLSGCGATWQSVSYTDDLYSIHNKIEIANRQKAEAEAIAEKLKSAQVKVSARAGANGKLFGAVTSKEVSDALAAQHKIELAKQKIVLDEPIKSFGTYQLKAKLGHEVTGTIHVIVAEAK